MAETYWTVAQSTNYLKANFPCESGVEADAMLWRKLEDGTLSARYCRPDGTTVSIGRREWRRVPQLGIVWSGSQREAEQEGHYGPYGSVEIAATPVVRLCARSAKGGDGRPPREIVERLNVLAGSWIEEHGIPSSGSGNQAKLERFLATQALGQLESESRIREIAVRAISIVAAYRRATPAMPVTTPSRSRRSE